MVDDMFCGRDGNTGAKRRRKGWVLFSLVEFLTYLLEKKERKRRKKMSKKKGYGKLLAGVAIGAGLGVLFAPKKGSDTRRELKEKIDEMLEKAKNIDKQEVKNNIENKISEIKKELEDLDKESFDIFRREAVRSKRMTKDDLNMSNAELLDSLDLLKDGKLTRAAVLLFHRTPQKWMFGTYTRIGKFGKGSDLQYQDEVIGSLFMQAERVIELIYLKYLKAPITYDNLTRVETYPFPKDAVREALYNALVHSRWSAGIPIQIRIEDDAMYISNECVFPSDWTMESLLQRHQSRPYNPKIARAFFRAGYIESWGRGIQKIFEVCNEYGALQPKYVVHSEDIMLKLAAVSITDKHVLKLDSKAENTALKMKIVEYLQNQPTATQKELQEALNETRTHIQKIVKELVGEGKIERKGGKRFGYWEVKK